jgi:splicing factor 3B subunit 2
MMASTHVYDISAAAASGNPQPRRSGGVDREGMVELALDPSELDMDNDAMAQRYEQQMREQQSHLQKEDLSDMLAEHIGRQKTKRKRQQNDTSGKQTKKYKEFKF